MLIDFSSRPPVPALNRSAPHLANYRRVYRASEAEVASEARASRGPGSASENAGGEAPDGTSAAGDPRGALAEYLRTYEELDAQAVVIKAKDVESTFGIKVANEDVARFCREHGPRFIGFAGVDPHKG